MFDSRAGMDPGLEPFNESFYMPLVLFRCHFPRHRNANRIDDNCAFECTGTNRVDEEYQSLTAGTECCWFKFLQRLYSQRLRLRKLKRVAAIDYLAPRAPAEKASRRKKDGLPVQPRELPRLHLLPSLASGLRTMPTRRLDSGHIGSDSPQWLPHAHKQPLSGTPREIGSNLSFQPGRMPMAQ